MDWIRFCTGTPLVREALAQRLEAALAAPDGQHSVKYRGTAYLPSQRIFGFALNC